MTFRLRFDRIIDMMCRWWAGESMASIGRQYGISRERARRLLARVGCTRKLWEGADRAAGDSRRRTSPLEVDLAQRMLQDPLAHALTNRQRGVLLWRAQGFVLADIARRMCTTPASVSQLKRAARQRLNQAIDRQAETAAGQRRSRAHAKMCAALDWSELLGPIGAGANRQRRGCTSVAHHA